MGRLMKDADFGDLKVLRNYYLMTVPQVSILAGAVLGALIAIGINVRLATGLFSIVYGSSLVIIHIVVREHFHHLKLYKLFLGFSVFFLTIGVVLVYCSLRAFI